MILYEGYFSVCGIYTDNEDEEEGEGEKRAVEKKRKNQKTRTSQRRMLIVARLSLPFSFDSVAVIGRYRPHSRANRAVASFLSTHT